MLPNIIAILLFYLAATIALFGMYTGTCTQGSADHMWGILLTAFLATIALAFLLRQQQRLAHLLCLPAAVFFVFQWVFSVQLAIAVGQGSSICQFLNPPTEYRMDGSEIELATLWVLTSTAIIALFSLSAWRTFRSKDRM